MNPKKIGAFLKQLRNEKGITQERLAEVVVQMLMTGNLSLVIGETVVLFAGGLIYIFPL